MEDLPWVIGLMQTYFTNGCEDNGAFHNTRKQSLVTSTGVMRRCVVQVDEDGPPQMHSAGKLLAKHTSSG